jgi:hypothetical protein
MLFHIEESVSDLISSGNPTQQDFDALVYLALASSEGNHRITGSRRALRQLAEAQSIGLSQRKAFERVASRVAQEGHLFHQLPTVGRIIADSQAIPSAANSGKRRIITLPLRWFDDSSKIQPTILLAENLSDVRVLMMIGEAGTILNSFGHLPLKHFPISGGGSTTRAVLNDLASTGRLCLCVVDSDRMCPSSALGSTAAAVQPYKDMAQFPLLDVIETVGRDLENALPDSFFSAEYGGHSIYGSISMLFSELTKNGESEVRSHFDIEKGLTLRSILDIDLNTAEGIFWRRKLSTILALVGIDSSSLPCLNQSTCSHQQGHLCTCIIVPGNHANVLDDFVTRHQNASRYELRAALDNSVRNEWVRLGSAVGSWCCGDERMRI